MQLKPLASIIGLLLLILLGLLVGAAILVLAATGLGWLASRLLPFTLFEASLLSLIALISILAVVWSILRVPLWDLDTATQDSDDEDDEDEEDEEEYLDDPPVSAIPLWRQPLKTANFQNVNPNDRCPCGSGRKYKICHGRRASQERS